jgi:hypothetical protein
MSYQSTVDSIRTAANTALASFVDYNSDDYHGADYQTTSLGGRFDHGRHVDISQKFDGAYPFIFLYPVTELRPDSPGFIDRSNILIGFWMQDRPDTSTLEREVIIAQMDALSDAFLNKLEENDKIRVTGVRKEPQYQMYQSTVSGFAIQFTLENYDVC